MDDSLQWGGGKLLNLRNLNHNPKWKNNLKSNIKHHLNLLNNLRNNSPNLNPNIRHLPRPNNSLNSNSNIRHLLNHNIPELQAPSLCLHPLNSLARIHPSPKLPRS